MRRVVLDPGVLVSALISPAGPPARLLEEALSGEVELVVSPKLLAELEGVLARPKFRRYVDLETARLYAGLLSREAVSEQDPGEGPGLHCEDPDDDYLIALARSARAVLVSGDKHLLTLADRAPILAPADLFAPAAQP